MKKSVLLLSFASLAVFTVNAQTAKSVGALELKPSMRKAVPVSSIPALRTGDEKLTYVKSAKRSSSTNAEKGKKIGSTIYDLQSNASVGRRIVNNGDGTLTAIWTIAGDFGPNYDSRGTGYAYSADGGKTWTPSPDQKTRLEDIRTGWPNIGTLANGKEVILSHSPTLAGLELGTNSAKGSTTTWSFDISGAGKNSGYTKGTLWNRMAVGGPDGNTLHCVSTYSDSLDGAKYIKLAGVKRPVLYSRSLDGGVTWNNAVTLPGYDSTRYDYGGGDDYAIDVKGSEVAIALAGLGTDVALWRSHDNGATFTKIYVDSMSVAHYGDNAPLDGARLASNDGTVTVVLDNNNKAHVAFGYCEVSRDTTVGSATYAKGVYYPGTIGLRYWNEINKTLDTIPINTLDVAPDSSYDIGSLTTSTSTTAGGASYRGTIATMPSISMDAAGNIFVTFSMPADNDSTDANGGRIAGQSYRDIWGVAKKVNATKWNRIHNLTNTMGIEEAFPSSARMVLNDNIDLVFMQDLEPGTALTNGDQDGDNDIKYLGIKASDLLNDVDTITVGFASVKNNLFSVSQNYPNPFNATSTISVNLKQAANVSLTVTNMLGQTMIQRNSNSNAGRFNFEINKSDLGAGIFFYTVKAGDFQVTKKMIVE